MESCPNLTNPPFNLLVKNIGELNLIPESTSSLDYNSYLKDSKKITSIGNFNVICNESIPPIMTLKITLTQSSTSIKSDWHTLLKTKLKKHLNDSNDFMLIEIINNKCRYHLLQYGKTPETIPSRDLTLWLIPINKIHLPENEKTPTPPEDTPVKKVSF